MAFQAFWRASSLGELFRFGEGLDRQGCRGQQRLALAHHRSGQLEQMIEVRAFRRRRGCREQAIEQRTGGHGTIRWARRNASPRSPMIFATSSSGALASFALASLNRTST